MIMCRIVFVSFLIALSSNIDAHASENQNRQLLHNLFACVSVFEDSNGAFGATDDDKKLGKVALLSLMGAVKLKFSTSEYQIVENLERSAANAEVQSIVKDSKPIQRSGVLKTCRMMAGLGSLSPITFYDFAEEQKVDQIDFIQKVDSGRQGFIHAGTKFYYLNAPDSVSGTTTARMEIKFPSGPVGWMDDKVKVIIISPIFDRRTGKKVRTQEITTYVLASDVDWD